MGQYSRISSPFGGPARYTNPGMVNAFKTYCAIKGIRLKDIYVIQGSFNKGVPASAGTHDGADCLDVTMGVDEYVLKLIGVVAWERKGGNWTGNEHTHLLRLYSSKLAWLAAAQGRAYIERGTDGQGSLSYPDRSKTPRVRGIRHLSGPTTSHYIVVSSTYSYNQPSGSAQDRRAPLKPGREIENIVGFVRARGKDWIVTAKDGKPIFTPKSKCAKLQVRGVALPRGVKYRVKSSSAPARPAPFKSAPVVKGWNVKHGTVFEASRMYGDFVRARKTLRWIHKSHLELVED